METIEVEVPKFNAKRDYDATLFEKTRSHSRVVEPLLIASVKRAKKDAAFRTALVGSLKHYTGCPDCAWQGTVRNGRKVLACETCPNWRAAFDVPTT